MKPVHLRMTMHTRSLSTDNEQNTAARLVVRGTNGPSDAHEGTKTMEPIDHPPGHQIKRLNREIEEQYADVEWTPASVIAIVLITLPFVAYGVHVLVTAGVFWEVVAIFGVVSGLWILSLKATA
jgi:hypothetical protein